MQKKIKVAICGTQGYVGQELLRLVLAHPHLHLGAIVMRNPDIKRFGLPASVPCFPVDQWQPCDIDCLLLATPPDASIELVTKFYATGIKIIDLSGAFRLSAAEAKAIYGLTTPLPGLEQGAHYGLSPWLPPDEKTSVIANPGCYATCVLMALIPLVKAGLIKSDHIIVDAKSGASGAGKTLNQQLMFCEMSQNFFAYKIDQHRHVPEMLKTLKLFSSDVSQMSFVPHVLPMLRGMSAALYLELADDVSREKAWSAITETYQDAYAGYPLLEFAALDQGMPEKDQWILSVKSVANTPKVHIAYYVDAQQRLFVFSNLDNLLKGAASQAIENLNAWYHWPLITGLGGE